MEGLTETEGETDGDLLGERETLGEVEGDNEGDNDGLLEGLKDTDGLTEGLRDGERLGLALGDKLGLFEGDFDGLREWETTVISPAEIISSAATIRSNLVKTSSFQDMRKCYQTLKDLCNIIVQSYSISP